MAESRCLGTLTVLHELYSLLLAPAVTVGGVAVSIDVSRAGSYTTGSRQLWGILCQIIGRTTDGPRLTEQTTTEGDVVHTRSGFFVPARDNDTRREPVLVVVAELLEDVCGHANGWRTSKGLPEQQYSAADGTAEGQTYEYI